MTSCLKRHLDKHCIRFDNILRTKARRETLLKPESSAQKLGDRTELTEREEPERNSPRPLHRSPS